MFTNWIVLFNIWSNFQKIVTNTLHSEINKNWSLQWLNMDFQNKLQTMQNDDDFLLKALQFNQATVLKKSIYIRILNVCPSNNQWNGCIYKWYLPIKLKYQYNIQEPGNTSNKHLRTQSEQFTNQSKIFFLHFVCSSII